MRGNCLNKPSGFSLIELMVVIGIILLMTTIAAPLYRGLLKRSERKQFVSKLNQLTGLAWRNAVVTNKIHAVVFDFTKGMVRAGPINPDSKEKGDCGEPKIGGIKTGGYVRSYVKIPPSIKLRQFIIEGVDETENRSLEKFCAWFFIVPNGITQEVTINLLDNKDKLSAGRSRPIGLVLNPFTAEFEAFDEFQK